MFDLDGTLADTLVDIAAAGNHVLTELGLPALPTPRYRYLAGQGAHWLVAEALGPDRAGQVPRGLELFKQYQLAHGLEHTEPYPGIPELLAELARRGLKLAVLSNKPDAATQVAIRTVLGRVGFDAVVGQRDDAPLKPDPRPALAIARRLGVEPEHWLYLGDTRVDMETARRAGFFAVGVLWGFREEPELRDAGAQAIIRHPREVLELLDRGG
jgi:phosphoglycolate phosphatase